MKKKHSHLLGKKNEKFISDSFNGTHSGMSLRDKIYSSLEMGERTYEDVLRFLRVSETEKDLQESVNDVLYEMLNNY